MSCLKQKTPDYLILINEDNRLPEKFVDTVELISVRNSEGTEYVIEKKTYEAFLRLREDLLKNDGIQAELISVYRTVAQQEKTFNGYVDKFGIEYARKYAAIPGHSEHHTGLAVDVSFVVEGRLPRLIKELLEMDDLFKIVHKKLAKYGFILRYPTVYSPEKIPTYIHQQNMYDAYKEVRDLAKIMNVTNSVELNKIVTE